MTKLETLGNKSYLILISLNLASVSLSPITTEDFMMSQQWEDSKGQLVMWCEEGLF